MKLFKIYTFCLFFAIWGVSTPANASYIYELFDTSLEMIKPTPTVYLENVDFTVLWHSGNGDITANLQTAGLGYESDFSEFIAGNIALIQRSEILFKDKVANAQAAGALGAIVYNYNPGVSLGTLMEPTTDIPSIFISGDLGAYWLSLMENQSVEIRIFVDGVSHLIPEPTTMLLFGLGLLGFAGVSRRKK